MFLCFYFFVTAQTNLRAAIGRKFDALRRKIDIARDRLTHELGQGQPVAVIWHENMKCHKVNHQPKPTKQNEQQNKQQIG